ncbi:MAG: mercury methylation ferredoxin HgcB [Bacteroidota bacterium]
MDGQKYLRKVSTLTYDASKCIGCTMCVEVCPHHVFEMIGKKARITDRDQCMECGACVINCRPGALAVKQGVGCASAVIWGFFRGTEPSCDCGAGKEASCC